MAELVKDRPKVFTIINKTSTTINDVHIIFGGAKIKKNINFEYINPHKKKTIQVILRSTVQKCNLKITIENKEYIVLKEFAANISEFNDKNYKSEDINRMYNFIFTVTDKGIDVLYN